MSDKKWTDERIAELSARIEAGASRAQIARDCGVTYERIRQLLNRHRRNLDKKARLDAGWAIVEGKWVSPDEAERIKAQS